MMMAASTSGNANCRTRITTGAKIFLSPLLLRFLRLIALAEALKKEIL